MIPVPLVPFMQRVLQATNSGDMNWREGAEEAYFSIHKDANIHIRYAYDEDSGESAYIFRIIRGHEEAFFAVYGNESDFNFMRNLFYAISVNATGGDKFINGLFD